MESYSAAAYLSISIMVATMRELFTTVVIICALPTVAASAERLTGSVEHIHIDGSQQAVPDVQRPDWLPARAYTNAALVTTIDEGLVLGIIPITVARWKSKRQLEGYITIGLSDEFQKYWKGKRYHRADVSLWPVSGDRHSFQFHTVGHDDGPTGWIQFTGRDAKGHVLYRYWFDDREQNSRLHEQAPASGEQKPQLRELDWVFREHGSK